MTEDGWTPTTEHRADIVTAAAAQALHDLLDSTDVPPADGAELPPLWHWLAFLPRARQEDLAPDGHPTTGAFLPPMHGQRRMHAGGQLDIQAPLHIGEQLQRSAQVTAVKTKAGRSGELTFVTVTNEITSATGRIRERTDLVYRPPTPAVAASPTPTPPAGTGSKVGDAATWEVQRIVHIEPTLLFRFSALTYNAHRIHYDRDYATRHEGYPGLIVHGPLQAILLAHLARQTAAGRTIRQFRYRADAPAFDTADLELRMRRIQRDEMDLAIYSAGVQTMSATALLETTPS